MDLKLLAAGATCAIALVVGVAVARATFFDSTADLNGRWRREDAAGAPQRSGPGAWATLPAGPGAAHPAPAPGAPEALTINGRRLTMVRDGTSAQLTCTPSGTADGGVLTWREPGTADERAIAFRLVADNDQPFLLLNWDGSTARYRRE